jgi:hypothetical protein
MKKEKILETLGEAVMTIIMIAVGVLIVGTAGTFLYQMFKAIFD